MRAGVFDANSRTKNLKKPQTGSLSRINILTTRKKLILTINVFKNMFPNRLVEPDKELN